jgi:hypothetical protein
MNKKLNAKIQKLVPILAEKEHAFSSSLAIEPEERELVLKKGSVYTVYEIKSPVEFDISLINKVINDVLFDSYYHSENISPIQSLEKAVVNINEKLTSLAAEEQAVKGAKPISDQKVQFNVVAGVLWGNVLYLVQYGQGNCFIMREGDINKVDATSEGNFSVASGVVKDDDVVVFCTEGFSGKYPPDKLLNTSLSSNDLEKDQACMIMKFVIDAEFTEDEAIDFNLKKEAKMPKVAAMLQNIKNKKNKKENGNNDAIATLADMEEKKKKTEPNIKLRASREARFKITPTHLILVVVVLLFISLGATIALRGGGEDAQNASGADGQDSLTMPKEMNKNEQPQQPNQPEQAEEPQEAEEDPTLVKLPVQPFYDIKLADENANPESIVLFNQTVVTTDSGSGKIFTSELSTPKFTALEDTFAGIAYAENYDGKLSFKDNEGYKTYDLVNNTTTQSFAGDFGLTNRYLGNIYSIEQNALKKYVPSGEELTESTWAEAEEFNNATAMDIAYSIYILTSDGNLSVYTQGEKTDFTISGLETPLNNSTDIIANTAFDNIYIADAGNNRIVIINTDGELVKQLKAEKEGEWGDLRDISVSSDETTMFVLSGSKVFEIDLTEALTEVE